MRICLISTEIFSHGFYGGFGALTRKIASGLSERGLEVYVVTPRRKGQAPIERIDNFTVVSYPGGTYTGVHRYKSFKTVFGMLDADVYHSEEPSLGTRLAQLGAPNKKHVITFQDPRTLEDWRKQWAGTRISKLEQVKFMMSYRLTVVRAVREADLLFSQAKYVIQKSQDIFALHAAPEFLPNPVDVPDYTPEKAVQPTVCFVGRWDPIKQPELFFELAKKFPRVRFIATGACQPGFADRERQLREAYSKVENLEMPGWVFQDQRNELLDRSWILINTSTKECLPVSYLEACARRCAILSHGNADQFASNFGFWTERGDLEDYSRGLEYLLESDRWRERGERGYEYVKNTHEFQSVINRHIEIYESLIGSNPEVVRTSGGATSIEHSAVNRERPAIAH